MDAHLESSILLLGEHLVHALEREPVVEVGDEVLDARAGLAEGLIGPVGEGLQTTAQTYGISIEHPRVSVQGAICLQ